MAVQKGVVRDRIDLADYVRTLTHLAATGDGVALLHAHRGAAAGDLDATASAASCTSTNTPRDLRG